jgi:hypothetical protein
MSTEATEAKSFGRIPEAIARSGLSKGSLYNLAAKHPGLFRKMGSATIVDFRILNEVLDALPAAELTPSDAA